MSVVINLRLLFVQLAYRFPLIKPFESFGLSLFCLISLSEQVYLSPFRKMTKDNRYLVTKYIALYNITNVHTSVHSYIMQTTYQLQQLHHALSCRNLTMLPSHVQVYVQNSDISLYLPLFHLPLRSEARRVG